MTAREVASARQIEVTPAYTGSCPCGRPSVTLGLRISRINNPGEDGRIGCAGTIDSTI